MRWEHLTSATFEEAVERARGVCVVPCGVIEAHGPHLPLETDLRVAHAVACEAASREPVIVFPPYLWGMNTETAHLPGGLILQLDLLLRLLEAVCGEIARNGLHKIVLYSAHGGDRLLHPLFVQDAVNKERPYTLYWLFRQAAPGLAEAIFSTPADHAGESETSLMLHLEPERVRMEALPERPGTPLARQAHLEGIYAGADWYAMYPEHYAGDARLATVEKGRAYFEACADRLAGLLRTIKEDAQTPAVYREYGARLYRRHPEA